MGIFLSCAYTHLYYIRQMAREQHRSLNCRKNHHKNIYYAQNVPRKQTISGWNGCVYALHVKVFHPVYPVPAVRYEPASYSLSFRSVLFYSILFCCLQCVQCVEVQYINGNGRASSFIQTVDYFLQDTPYTVSRTSTVCCMPSTMLLSSPLVALLRTIFIRNDSSTQQNIY